MYSITSLYHCWVFSILTSGIKIFLCEEPVSWHWYWFSRTTTAQYKQTTILWFKIIFSSFDFWHRRTILIETSFCHASKLKLSTILLKDKSKKILDDSNFLFPLYVHSRFDWTFLNTLECEGNYWCVYLIFICASSPNSFLFMPNIAAKSSFTVSCP